MVITLTDREKQVLQLVANGWTHDMIAEKLCISIKGVDAHMQRIYQKQGTFKAAAAVAHALRRGDIE